MFLGSASEVDQKEAFEIGLHSVKYSCKNPSSFSVGIKERKVFSESYKVQYIQNPLVDIARKNQAYGFFIIKKSFMLLKNLRITVCP